MSFFFFFNDTATTEIYTLSLHDALPICKSRDLVYALASKGAGALLLYPHPCRNHLRERSEEHTSELQSLAYLVCRLLLEKKKIHTPDRYVGVRAVADTPPPHRGSPHHTL